MLNTITKQESAREAFEAFCRHFFTALFEECPACGRTDCDAWQVVRSVAAPSSETVLAIRGAGVGPR